VEVTKDDLGFSWALEACSSKGFRLLGFEIMYFSCCTRSYLHAYTDYIVTRRDVNNGTRRYEEKGVRHW